MPVDNVNHRGNWGLGPKDAEIARLRKALAELVLQIERCDPIDTAGDLGDWRRHR
jgi:hypothetical protein